MEVTMASAVLLLALTGVMGGAFAVLKGTGTADRGTQAANLCAERLAYFRACPNPYIAVGGTHYPPPADKLKDKDLNAEDDPATRSKYHNIFNRTPVLLVREYLYETTEGRFVNRAAGLDRGRANLQARHLEQTATNTPLMRNVIPPMVAEVMSGTVEYDVAGVFPNRETIAKTGPDLLTNENVSLPNVQNPRSVNLAFIQAPRANEHLVSSGGALDLTAHADVKFVREVWTQTNSPLGAPYSTAADEAVQNFSITPPQVYSGANNAFVQTFSRNPDQGNDAAAGTTSLPVPLWTVTVTVRVFARIPTDRRLLDIGLSPSGVKGDGLGYDPARPLATMTGYFSLRRTLGF